ncbi:MAG: hypothetical protein ACYTKD_06135 [Planctomycetota bacterium]|jgi:hypothetical protein
MRYSYAWRASPTSYQVRWRHGVDAGRLHPPRRTRVPYLVSDAAGTFSKVEGLLTELRRGRLRRLVLVEEGAAASFRPPSFAVHFGERGSIPWIDPTMAVTGHTTTLRPPNFLVLDGYRGQAKIGSKITVVGRIGLCVLDDIVQNGPPWPRIDASASRFTGASISGLVVGAMGCFIFGLYLRRWLIDRKALAGTPPPDMIA